MNTYLIGYSQQARDRVSDLLFSIGGGSSHLWDALCVRSCADDSGVPVHYGDVVDVLKGERVPLSEVILHDVRAAIRGEALRYFAPERDFVSRYRLRMGITPDPDPGSDGFVPLWDSIGALFDQSITYREQAERYGATQAMYDAGFACWTEQRSFYASPEWRDRARAVYAMDGYACRLCGARDVKLEAHHFEPIYSAYHRLFYRNFDTCRIRSACAQCHHRFHETHARTEAGFLLAPPADKPDAKRRYRAAMRLHDNLRTCQHCTAHVWKSETA